MAKTVTGIALAPGLHVGRVNIVDAKYTLWEAPVTHKGPIDTDAEMKKLGIAFKQLYADIMDECAVAQEKKQDEYVELLAGYAEIIDDESLIGEMNEYITSKNCPAQSALFVVGSAYLKDIAELDSEYLRERVNDIQMLFSLIFAILDGRYQGFKKLDASKHSVFVAHDMVASDIVSLAGNCALVLSARSKTSHLIIMSRSYGIPVVGGIDNPEEIFKQDQIVIVDGDKGEVILDPSEQEQAQALARIEEEKKLASVVRSELKNTHGKVIKLYANIGGVKDLELVLKNTADGIGLFRTEFLFMEGKSLPTEDEQYKVYSEVLRAMNGKEVVIRTLDVGGDKELEALGMPKEDNPFLGWRSIRYCLDNPAIFRTQLRAMMRASVHGKLAIMIPMIISPSEMAQTRALLDEIKSELQDKNIAFAKDVSLGMMVETPAAAICIEDFIPVSDFFSIGTNDLTQYVLAVDRCNERIAKLYDSYHPAVVAMLKQVITCANRHNKKVSMCGELAGDTKATKMLLDMGLCTFSMSAPRIPVVYGELKKILN